MVRHLSECFFGTRPSEEIQKLEKGGVQKGPTV